MTSPTTAVAGAPAPTASSPIVPAQTADASKPTLAAATKAPASKQADTAKAPAPARFVTTTEDAPAVPAKRRTLNPKTLAEQEAGAAALSQYTPAAE